MDVNARLQAFEASLPDQTTADLKAAKKDLLQATLKGKPINRTRDIDTKMGWLITQELARRERALEQEGKPEPTEAERLANITKQPVATMQKHLERKKNKESDDMRKYVEKLDKKDKDFYEKVDKEILRVTGQPAVKKESNVDNVH